MIEKFKNVAFLLVLVLLAVSAVFSASITIDKKHFDLFVQKIEISGGAFIPSSLVTCYINDVYSGEELARNSFLSDSSGNFKGELVFNVQSYKYLRLRCSDLVNTNVPFFSILPLSKDYVFYYVVFIFHS